MSEGIYPYLIKKKKSSGNSYEQESMSFLPFVPFRGIVWINFGSEGFEKKHLRNCHTQSSDEKEIPPVSGKPLTLRNNTSEKKQTWTSNPTTQPWPRRVQMLS